jgi:hypothetical protein
MANRFDEMDDALARGSRDPDGSMTWGSAARGDQMLWAALSRGWVGWASTVIGVAALLALVVWLFG